MSCSSLSNCSLLSLLNKLSLILHSNPCIMFCRIGGIDIILLATINRTQRQNLITSSKIHFFLCLFFFFGFFSFFFDSVMFCFLHCLLCFYLPFLLELSLHALSKILSFQLSSIVGFSCCFKEASFSRRFLRNNNERRF